MIIKIGHIKYHALTVKKVLMLLAISTPLTFVLGFIQKYIYSDWDFLINLLILIAIDTALGFGKAWKYNKVSSAGFGAILIKLALYMFVLIACHVFTSFTINGIHSSVLDWVDNFIFTSLIVREGISIFENISAIQPNIIPAWLLKKMESFNSESGEFEGKEADKNQTTNGNNS